MKYGCWFVYPIIYISFNLSYNTIDGCIKPAFNNAGLFLHDFCCKTLIFCIDLDDIYSGIQLG